MSVCLLGRSTAERPSGNVFSRGYEHYVFPRDNLHDHEGHAAIWLFKVHSIGSGLAVQSKYNSI